MVRRELNSSSSSAFASASSHAPVITPSAVDLRAHLQHQKQSLFVPSVQHLPGHSSKAQDQAGHSSADLYSQGAPTVQQRGEKEPLGIARQLQLQHRREEEREKHWSDTFGGLGEGLIFVQGVGQSLARRIPGLRYSAAFFSTLSANLALSSSFSPDTPSFFSTSTTSTPSSMRASTNMPPPSPLSNSTTLTPPDPAETDNTPNKKSQSEIITANGEDLSAFHERKIVKDEEGAEGKEREEGEEGDSLAEVPPLTTYLATSRSDKIAALKLVADSIAQQRQTASSIMILHPLSLALALCILAIVAQFLYHEPSDLFLIGTTWSGCIMAGLITVRLLTGGYLEAAERINFRWLVADGKVGKGEGGGGVEEEAEEEPEDEILVTKFGNDIIGTAVLRTIKNETPSGGEAPTKKEKKPKSKATGTSREQAGAGADTGTTTIAIRAWTVRRRERRKGVGRALLEETVKLGMSEQGCEKVVFATDHANSPKVLPPIYNSTFERKWARARNLLNEVIDSQA